MQTERRQTQNHITRPNSISIQDASTLHPSNNAAREIVFISGIEARHLRRLTAHEGAADLAARAGQALHNFGNDFRMQFARGNVIEEEERGRAVNGNVVDAVVHQVGAHSVMPIQREGELQLGAHAVNA